MQLKKANPFIGARSYEEKDKDIFFGREEEAIDLFQLVNINAFTLLYGKSGLGKTSALQAGLFPKLRKANFLPIYIRPGYKDKKKDFVKEVENIIIKVVEANKYERVPVTSKESLWEYFHRFPIKDKKGARIIPVLVFDQFEELFTLGTEDKSSQLRENTKKLVDFLSDLIENSPPIILDEEKRLELQFKYGSEKTQVKIIFSFREEYLGDFYDLAKYIPSIAYSNLQYKLSPLNFDKGYKIIKNASGDLFEKSAIEETLRVITESTTVEEARKRDIDSFLLSIFCENQIEHSLANNISVITSSEIKNINIQNLVYSKYQVIINELELNSDEKKLLEERLLSPEGFRWPVYLDYALFNPEIREEKIQALEEKKILKRYFIDGRFVIEIIHDKYAAAIKKERDFRKDAEQKQLQILIDQDKQKAELEKQEKQQIQEKLKLKSKNQNLLIVVGIISLGAAALTTNLYFKADKQTEIAVSEKQLADKARQQTEIQREIAVLALTKAREKETQTRLALGQVENEKQKTDSLLILLNAQTRSLNKTLKDRIIINDSLDTSNSKLKLSNQKLDSLRQKDKKLEFANKLANLAAVYDSAELSANWLALSYYINKLYNPEVLNPHLFRALNSKLEYSDGESINVPGITSFNVINNQLLTTDYNNAQFTIRSVHSSGSGNFKTKEFSFNTTLAHIQTKWITPDYILLTLREKDQKGFINYVIDINKNEKREINSKSFIKDILFLPQINKTLTLQFDSINSTNRLSFWNGLFEKENSVKLDEKMPKRFFADNNQKLWVFFQTGMIKTYKINRDDLTFLENYNKFDQEINDVIYSEEKSRFYVLNPNLISVLDINSGEIISENSVNSFYIRSAVISPDSKFIFVFSKKVETVSYKTTGKTSNEMLLLFSADNLEWADIAKYEWSLDLKGADFIRMFNNHLYYCNKRDYISSIPYEPIDIIKLLIKGTEPMTFEQLNLFHYFNKSEVLGIDKELKNIIADQNYKNLFLTK